MTNCCEDKGCAIEALRAKQARVLKIVLAINTGMFFTEFAAGLLAQSMALLGDSLDMLGDALVYGFSLYVLGRGATWRAGAALLKSMIMLAFGLGVLWVAVDKLLHPAVPIAETMGLIGLLALAANGVCLFLLTRHRQDDINMRSVWICSRNDILANLGVLTAAVMVSYTQSMWPDIVIGLGIATLFLASAFKVTAESVRELSAEMNPKF